MNDVVAQAKLYPKPLRGEAESINCWLLSSSMSDSEVKKLAFRTDSEEKSLPSVSHLIW